jgi:hypothetical protein
MRPKRQETMNPMGEGEEKMRTRSILLSALLTFAPAALAAAVLLKPAPAAAFGGGLMLRLESGLSRLEALNNSRPRDEFYFHVAKCIAASRDRLDDIRLGRQNPDVALQQLDDTLYGLLQYNQAGRLPHVAHLSARIDAVALDLRALIANRGGRGWGRPPVHHHPVPGYRPSNSYYNPPPAPVYTPPVYQRRPHGLASASPWEVPPAYVPPPAPAYVPAPAAPCDGTSQIGYRSW